MIFLAVILFIVIFSTLILIHELGHFWAAKRANVKVEEFGFGLPPRLFGIKKGETIYSVNLIPFGGFVRLFGEDSTSEEARKSKRSFVNKSLRAQAKIVCAGVIMNLLLAFALLSFGFMIGIEPLIASEEDFNIAIQDGYVELEPGIVDIKSGERILTLNNKQILSIEDFEKEIEKVKNENASVLVNGSKTLNKEDLEKMDFSPVYIHRLVYLEQPDSSFNAALKNGDIILKIDGSKIIEDEDLLNSMNFKKTIELEFFRENEGVKIANIDLKVNYPFITYVEPGSPAEMAGLKIGDQITALNGEETLTSGGIVHYLGGTKAEKINYTIVRGEEKFDVEITLNEEHRAGVVLSDITTYPELSFYESYVPHTVMDIKDIKYPILSYNDFNGWEFHPFQAFGMAIKEMWRLGKMTAVMFLGVLGNFISGGEVPEGVSGPVGIAQMTYYFMQDGFAAIIRFVALLSLSLGVINILPLPALDGGKLLFIIVEIIRGKRANPKIEAWIHTAGFVFLLLFIAYITFNDLLRLF